MRAARGSAAAVAVALALACIALPAAAAPAPFTRAQMEADPGAADWLVVYGSLDADATPALAARARLVARRLFELDSSRVRADHEVRDAELERHSLLLIGGPRENAVSRRIAPALPVRFEDRAFVWAGTRYAGADDAIHLLYPNPRAPRRFVLVLAANSTAALTGRGFWPGDSDWRIFRAGDLVRSGSFAQTGGAPWRYEAALDRDRERERAGFEKGLSVSAARGLRVRTAPGVAGADVLRAGAEVTLARLDAMGFADRRGRAIEVTLYPHLESLGAITRDTRPEQLDDAGAVHAALPAGRTRLDGHGIAAARFLALGASRESIWLEPAAVWIAGRYEGETLERSIARLYFARILPGAADAAAPLTRWRSPLRLVPARALLVRAIYEVAAGGGPAAVRRIMSLEGETDFAAVCEAAGVSAARVRERYGVLADSLARAGRDDRRGARPAPWTPADGFQTGVCLAHAVSLEGGYASQACARELAALRRMGAGWISLTPFGYLPSLGTPVIRPSADGGANEETDESLVEAGQRARALGMRVMLKPHLWSRGWIGELDFPAAGWNAFFEQYREFILHHAVIAQREGFDALVIGHELVTASLGFPDRWRALIGDVRRVYSGTLTYGANWGEEIGGIAFWDALDVVSVSFYEPLAASPTRSVPVLRAGAEQALAKLEAIARRTGKPVLLSEVGYAPMADAPVKPWEERRGAIDLEAQRACYEALTRALEGKSWVAGAYFWKWFTSPGTGGAMDGSFTPRGKPAEAVMRHALRTWARRSVNARP